MELIYKPWIFVLFIEIGLDGIIYWFPLLLIIWRNQISTSGSAGDAINCRRLVVLSIDTNSPEIVGISNVNKPTFISLLIRSRVYDLLGQSPVLWCMVPLSQCALIIPYLLSLSLIQLQLQQQQTPFIEYFITVKCRSCRRWHEYEAKDDVHDVYGLDNLSPVVAEPQTKPMIDCRPLCSHLG